MQVEEIAGEQLLRAIGQFIHENRKVIMANVNIRAMSLACENPWFRGLLNQSDIDFCDGSGVRIAARLVGRPIHDRLTYAEWMRELAQYSEARQNSLFFLWALINAVVALPAGAVFDYLSGDWRRAPPWMTETGVEWLCHLLIEPRRLWKRYLLGNPIFFWKVSLHDVAGRPLPVSGPDVGAAT